MEGNELAIEFKSPAANIVGFEHKARTLKEKQRIDRAEALLSDHRKLFMFDGSTCTLQKVEVDTLSVVSESRHHLDHHGRQDHSHHGNVGSNYQFTCKNLYKIRSISIRLQAYFEQIETLNVMWLNGIRQGLETLKASNNTIHFEKVR